jgi:hypothetical protein
MVSCAMTCVSRKDPPPSLYNWSGKIGCLSVQAPPSVFDTRRPGINELAYSKDGLLAVAAGPGTAGEVFLFD